jgi:protein ImuB
VEGVEHRLPELVEALAAQLERDGQGARRLALTAFRVDGRTTASRSASAPPRASPSACSACSVTPVWSASTSASAPTL